MRLNWSNLGKGLEAVAKAKIARDVSAAGDKVPAVTEGAYGPELQQNIQQVQGLRAKAAQDAAYNTGGSEDAIAAAEQQYNPALEELQRRSGLTQADYSVGGSPNYASRERAMAEQGLMRAQLEAEAYRKFGMTDKANEIEGLALNRKLQLTAEDRALSAEARAQAGETRAQAGETRAGKQFTTEQAMRQLGLTKAEREATEQANMDQFTAAVANLDPKLQQDPDTLFALAKQAKLTPTQINSTIEQITGLDKGAMTLMDSYIDKQFKANPTISSLAEVYKSDPKFDDKSHFTYDTDPKTGAVTVTFVKTNPDGSDGPPLGRPRVFQSEDEAIGQLQAEAKDPKAKASWAVAERDRKVEQQKLQNDVERINIARKSLTVDQQRLQEQQAQNDREKIRNLQADARTERYTAAQIKNLEAETLLRESKVAGKITDDSILTATMRLMAVDPELTPSAAAARVRAAAKAISGQSEAEQAAALKKLAELNASKGGRQQPPPVGLQ